MIIPQPKQSALTQETKQYPLHICCRETAFSAAAAPFSAYAEQAYGLSFTEGEDGIILERDSACRAGGYRLTAGENIVLSAGDTAGAHHGLATLLQLIAPEEGGFSCPAGTVEDWPDCSHRGLMVDLARQWHAFDSLLHDVDLCWLYKINKLQLHFTDDQSFTLPMKAYPKLSTPGRSYTEEQIARLVAYADARGVELIPEVEVPGHCAQFLKAYPELFGDSGVLPADEAVFDALETVYAEVCALFPHSPHIHVGGDEACVANWNGCARTQAYMKAHNITDIQEMYARYVKEITERVLAMGRTPIVWEGFHKEYNHLISKKVLVVSWENYYQPAYDLAADGFTLINCSWKPLYIVTPGTYWTPEEILNWHPHNWQHWFDKSAAYPDGFTIGEENVVLGGQLCAWGDVLQDYEDPLKGCLEELVLIEERLPALAEATWNAGPAQKRPAAEDFAQAAKLLDRIRREIKE